MKAFIIATFVLSLLVASVFANSVFIGHLTERFSKEVEKINETDPEIAGAEISEIYAKFKKAEKVISITTSHEDLTTIEESFAEMIGAAEVGDMDSLVTIKSRLRNSFEHLGRLSGINIDSII